MLLSKVFGDKSRFAVEVMHDPMTSGPHMIIGFFVYWINNKCIGRHIYEHLTHALKDMRDAGIHKTGHRAGGSFCALSPAEFINWWDEHLWLKDSPDEDRQTWSDDLWDDHRRFSLDFDFSNNPDFKLYLLDCGGRGRLIWYDDENRPAIVIEDDIGHFETILGNAYDYMSALDGFAGYKTYLTDREYRVYTNRSAVAWHSTRVRTMRMVDSHRGDAIADHLFLYRSRYGQSHVRAFALERLTGRGAVKDLHIESSAPDAMEVASDGDDLNGVEVHRAWPVLSDEDRGRFPSGATFHPNRSIPVRQHLMSLQGRDDALDAVAWFSVQIRMAFMVEGKGCDGLVDYVHLVRAADFDAAFDRALAIGHSKERTRLCYDHPPIRFQFVEARTLNLLGVGELGDVIEIHVEPPVDRLKYDWTPLQNDEARAGLVSREIELGLADL